MVGNNHFSCKCITIQVLLHVGITPAGPCKHATRVVPFALTCIIIGEYILFYHTLAALGKFTIFVSGIEIEYGIVIVTFYIEEWSNVAYGHIRVVKEGFKGKIVRYFTTGTSTQGILVIFREFFRTFFYYFCQEWL